MRIRAYQSEDQECLEACILELQNFERTLEPDRVEGAQMVARSKEIAARLGITAATVAAHLTNIYSKLGADSRASAVAIALQRGLLSMGDEDDLL